MLIKSKIPRSNVIALSFDVSLTVSLSLSGWLNVASLECPHGPKFEKKTSYFRKYFIPCTGFATKMHIIKTSKKVLVDQWQGHYQVTEGYLRGRGGFFPREQR